jgi:soluble lytic murein transglycosylase
MPVALLNLRFSTWVRNVGILLFLIAGAFSPQLQAKQSIEQQRQLFHEASSALERNQITRFNRLLEQLGDYPAAPYLKYDAFKRSANRVKTTQAETFFKHYAEFPFVYHARGKWLNVLAKRRDWENYLEFFDNRENTRLRCLAFQARLNLNQHEGLNDEIAKVWLRGYSQPSQCDPAFAYFLKNYEQAQEAVWLRIEKAFKARRPKLARHLSKQLGREDQATVATWYRAHQRPERELKKLGEAEDTVHNRAIIVHAIDRLARKDSLKALEFWNLNRDHFAFTGEQKKQVQLRIALSAAYQHEPEARTLLANLEPSAMNDQAFLWLARIQLRSQDWSGLLDTINRMPTHLQQENEWQYWLSRSMEAEGQLV